MAGKYQVFLSCKSLDEDGNQTPDSSLANQLYQFLSQKGLAVFYSSFSLEDLGVSAYKQAIDDALDQAKILVAVGTSAENFSSQWVRYEWDSFLNDILSGIKQDGRVFVYMDNVQLTELPRALRQTQVFQHGHGSPERLYRFVSAALGRKQSTFMDCPWCGQPFELSEENAERTCPHCKKNVIVAGDVDSSVDSDREKKECAEAGEATDELRKKRKARFPLVVTAAVLATIAVVAVYLGMSALNRQQVTGGDSSTQGRKPSTQPMDSPPKIEKREAPDGAASSSHQPKQGDVITNSKVEPDEKGFGTLFGRFVWADGTPVTAGYVRIADKIDVNNSGLTGYEWIAQQTDIATDVQVRELAIKEDGHFAYERLPAGKYYLFFRVPGTSEEGWLYNYTRPWYVVGHLFGSMPDPDEYEVRNGRQTEVPTIELIRRVEPSGPIAVGNKDGVYRFEWKVNGDGRSSRISIEHTHYKGHLQHPAYGTHEWKGHTYEVAEQTPLHPGPHRFKVEMLTSTLRVYGRSEWQAFRVPGLVFDLNIEEVTSDASGTTIRWAGSDAIKAVQIKSVDGDFTKSTNKRLLKLPPVETKKTFEFRALDTEGKELIPGWIITFWQSPTVPDPKK